MIGSARESSALYLFGALFAAGRAAIRRDDGSAMIRRDSSFFDRRYKLSLSLLMLVVCVSCLRRMVFARCDLSWLHFIIVLYHVGPTQRELLLRSQLSAAKVGAA